MHKQQTEIALDAGSRVPRGGAELSGLQLQTRTAARHSHHGGHLFVKDRWRTKLLRKDFFLDMTDVDG